MKELDIKTSFEWIESLIRAQIPPTAALPYLARLANEKLPHTDWETLSTIDTASDNQKFADWLSALITNDPPQASIRALWFGLFNPILSDNEGHYVTPQIYIGGGCSTDLDESGTTDYWVDGRYFESSVLDTTYMIAYGSENPLGNSAEYLMGLGYACSLVIHTAKQLGSQLLTFGITERDIIAGFDSGDFITLGTVNQAGFQPAKHLH